MTQSLQEFTSGLSEEERRTAAVSVVTVIPPTARRTNLNNTDIFSHGEIEYDLYCDVDGRPAPELNWYKVCSFIHGTWYARQCCGSVSTWIHMFLGLLDTDPLVRGMDPDPDPSFTQQK